MTKNNNIISLILLMLSISIESMGFLFVLTIMPLLFIEDSHSGFGLGTSTLLRSTYYGIAIACWPLGAFFGAPLLGSISDIVGRKKVLITCLFLTGVSYIFAAWSIDVRNPFLFFLIRLVAGFFGSSYEIAQAATVDISTEKARARNMGCVVFAFAFGMLIGPLLAFTTSSPRFFNHGCSITTPFYIASILALVDALGMLVFFKEKQQRDFNKNYGWIKHCFSSFFFMLFDVRVRKLGVISFFSYIAFGLYMIAMPMLLLQRFQIGIDGTEFFYCILGGSCALSLLFIFPTIAKVFSLDKIYIYTAFTLAVVLFMTRLFLHSNLIWGGVFVVSIGEMLGYSSLLALTSMCVSRIEQGKVMGGLGAIYSLTLVLSGFTLPIMSGVNSLFPIMIAGAAYLLGAVLMITYRCKE